MDHLDALLGNQGSRDWNEDSNLAKRSQKSVKSGRDSNIQWDEIKVFF